MKITKNKLKQLIKEAIHDSHGKRTWTRRAGVASGGIPHDPEEVRGLDKWLSFMTNPTVTGMKDLFAAVKKLTEMPDWSSEQRSQAAIQAVRIAEHQILQLENLLNTLRAMSTEQRGVGLAGGFGRRVPKPEDME